MEPQPPVDGGRPAAAAVGRAGDEAGAVEVVYATRDQQAIVPVAWEPGLTAGEAAARSGLLDRYRDARGRPLLLGVFGVPVSPERLVRPGERVEICRPLTADPRDRRRELSARGAVIGGRVSPDFGRRGRD